MAQTTNFTWWVSSMYTASGVPDMPDYVAMVTWRLTATDGKNTVEVGNNAQFPETESDPNFIPYSNLTQEIVLNWVKDQLGTDGVEFYKAKAQAQLDELAKPPLVPEYTPLPWSTN